MTAGLIAILRGVRPDEVVAVADVLCEVGFRVIEVPLNSPQPLDSIERLARHLGDGVMVGAGTVRTAGEVEAVRDAGARLVLSPHRDVAVIRRTVDLGLQSMPGVATPTEAFDALDAGAHALKLFPADILGPASFKAWASVLPAGTPMYAVGGVDANNLGAFRRAGARGAGLGSSLYQSGIAAPELRRRALALCAAWGAEG